MDLNYAPVGATQIQEPVWQSRPQGFRAYERTVPIGRGDDDWKAACAAVMSWAVKTRSGFSVSSDDSPKSEAVESHDYTLIAGLGPLRIREPVRVVATVDQPDRCGFAYGTRRGHPVAGEEAFVVSRSLDGLISLTLRSLTQAPTGPWRLAYPLALVAQRWYRARYARSLTG